MYSKRTHLISHEDMICICLCYYKACHKWLLMTCHKSCFSRHVKKDAWEIYTRSRVVTVQNQEKGIGSTRLKSIGNNESYCSTVENAWCNDLINQKDGNQTAWEHENQKGLKPNRISSLHESCRYTDWRLNLLHGVFTAVFVGSRTVNSLLPPACLWLHLNHHENMKQKLFGTECDSHTTARRPKIPNWTLVFLRVVSNKTRTRKKGWNKNSLEQSVTHTHTHLYIYIYIYYAYKYIWVYQNIDLNDTETT